MSAGVIGIPRNHGEIFMRLSDEGLAASPDCVSWVSPAEEPLHSNRWHLNSGLFKNLASGYESLCEFTPVISQNLYYCFGRGSRLCIHAAFG